MTDQGSRDLDAEPSPGGARRLLPTIAALACGGPVALAVAGMLRGPEAVGAAAIAWGLVFGSALGGVLLGGWCFPRSDQALQRLLVAMALRSGLPLAACAWALLTKSWFAAAGGVYAVLALYLLGLLVETWRDAAALAADRRAAARRPVEGR